jgi:hypothetical protein
MTPSAELRTRLRKLLSEKIPEGRTEADTRFLDSELDDLLKEASNIYGAASKGWAMKAALLQDELGQIEQYSVGQETYKKINLSTAIDSALKLAKQYSDMARSGGSGMIFKVKPPEVL